MILAVDVHYLDTGAVVAGVLFDHWARCEGNHEVTARIRSVEPYQPGQFYKRELPCILAILEKLPLQPTTIVVDGYVYLGSEKRPGLGYHLFEALDAAVAVIGVAKNRFEGTLDEAELIRGNSQRPLYVTAVGIDQTQAKQRIATMCGRHRIPTLLKRVDQLCRDGGS